MDTAKSYFIQQANKYGILFVRERNPEEDLTGWGALEFILNNGEIFVVSGYQFGQGEGEEDLWVDMHALSEKDFNEFKAKVPPKEPAIVDPDKSVEDYLIHHIDDDSIQKIMGV